MSDNKLSNQEVARLILKDRHDKGQLLLLLKALSTTDMEIVASVALHESDLKDKIVALVAAKKALSLADREFNVAFTTLARRLVPEAMAAQDQLASRQRRYAVEARGQSETGVDMMIGEESDDESADQSDDMSEFSSTVDYGDKEAES